MNEIEINNLKNLDVCGTDTLKTLTHKTFSQFFDSITHEYQINTKIHVTRAKLVSDGEQNMLYTKS